MGVKKGQLLDVEISDVAFGGRGLARVNGLAVFVDQAAPLDQARIRIIRKRKNYAEAILVELLRPSPYR
ncbi:MAG: TRAM domain-containing protein, partial [Desulfobacterales bacterium]